MGLREDLRAQGEFLFRHRSTLPLAALALYALALPGSDWIEQRHGDLVDDAFDWTCVLLSSLGLALRVYVAGTVPRRTSGRSPGRVCGRSS